MAENMGCANAPHPLKNEKQLKQRGGKRRSLTVQEKVRIVREIESGRTQSDVCRDRDLVHSTVSKIWKQRERIVAAFEMDVTKSRRLRGAARKDLDASLLLWFNFQRSQNMSVNGPALQSKAEELARLGGDLDFHCSSGWIDRFKARHNIAFTKGRSASARARATAYNTEWLANVWPDLRRDYEDDDVFGADEMGLYYRLSPNKTTSEFAPAADEDLFSVLVCTNMTGTEKRRLVVIGKSSGLRCFDGIRSLPVRYEVNPRAWMTLDTFHSVLRDWDGELQQTGRKILLLVDSCPAHPRTSAGLECIKLIHLPATVSHPLSEGVIRILKNHYRRLLMMLFMSGGESSVTVLDAIRMLHRSWLRVCEQSIRNSFICTGLTELTPVVETDGTMDDDLLLSEWVAQRTAGSANLLFGGNGGECNNADSIDEYARIDDTIITTSPPSIDVAIGQHPSTAPSAVPPPPPPVMHCQRDINHHHHHHNHNQQQQSPTMLLDMSGGKDQVPTAKDALHAARLVSHFLELNDVTPALLDDSARVQNQIESIVWSNKIRSDCDSIGQKENSWVERTVTNEADRVRMAGPTEVSLQRYYQEEGT